MFIDERIREHVIVNSILFREHKAGIKKELYKN